MNKLSFIEFYKANEGLSNTDNTIVQSMLDHIKIYNPDLYKNWEIKYDWYKSDTNNLSPAGKAMNSIPGGSV